MHDFHKHREEDNHAHGEHNIKNHDKEHSHDQYEHKHNEKALKWILGITLGYAFVELGAAFWSKSLALFADFAHMITDSASIFFAIIMAILSKKPANEKFSYGHGRADTIGAFINAMFMVFISIVIVYEAINRLFHPVDVNGLGVIVVSTIGLFVNLIGLKLLHGAESLNTKAAFVHILGDLLGTVAAIMSGVIIYYGGYMIADPLLSIAVSIIILFPAIKILKSAVKILMEGVPNHIDYNEVGHSIKEVKGVKSVHDLHIWTMSSNDVALSAHVLIDELEDWHESLDNIQEMLIKEYKIVHVTIQPEIDEAHFKNCHV
ncbi:cation diffusion facilitator family transporter [Shigella flexneri]